MINLRPSKAADIKTLSALRYGSPPIGVMLLRELVRNAERGQLLEQARHGLQALSDQVSAIARDDSTDSGRREKAADFLIHLRARAGGAKSLAQVIDRVAEAAAEARCRSGSILDYLSTWLFIAGEEFIASVSDARCAIDLEFAHPTVWTRFRGSLLEHLEAGAQRLQSGRRFRLAESYLAKFRLMRARGGERDRFEASPPDSTDQAFAKSTPDYVITMVVDLFVLGLSDVQQTLIVSQIPPPQATQNYGICLHDHHRLWQPLRGVRTQQGFERWSKLCQELTLSPRASITQFASGLGAHLQSTWNWFFPGRSPYGLVRAALLQIENAATDEVSADEADDLAARLFRRYAETLSFVVKLATEDSESSVIDLDREDSSEGVLQS